MSVFSFSFINVDTSSKHPFFLKFYKIDKEFISFFKTRILAPYLAVFVSPKTILSRLSETNEQPLKRTGKKSSTMNLLLSFLHVSFIGNWRMLLIFIMLLAGAFGKRFYRRVSGYSPLPEPGPDMRFYSIWTLKFINPLQKHLNNRSNEYDIEKDNFFLWGNNPHFESIIRSAGFFYAYRVRVMPVCNTIISHNEVENHE